MYLIFFLKVSILTIVFSIFAILFFSNTKQIAYTDHEQKDSPGKTMPLESITSVDNKQANSIIQEIVNKNMNQEHYSASEEYSKKQYQQICTRYTSICQKTTRDGIFSEQERLQYQALIIYLLKNENNYLNTSKNIEHVLSYLKIYKDAEWRRWSAGHEHIRINSEKIDNGREFWQVLSHELGHIIDFSLITWKSSLKDAIFTEFGRPTWAIDDPSLEFYKISRTNETTRKKSAKQKDFVSGYAMKWVYEDFAESVQLWFNHHDYFKKLAQSNSALQKKYDYIAQIYHNKYFRAHLFSSYPSINVRKWDSTRLE